MTIRRIIDWAIAQQDGELVGTIASDFYQLAGDDNNWMYACDVDIGQPEVLRNVPVASNNRELIYAQVGKAVSLKRMGASGWCIVGLAKTCRGMGHLMYVSFEDDIAKVMDDTWYGYRTRILTYEELDTYGGYGVLPYGAIGRFDPAGNLLQLLGETE